MLMKNERPTRRQFLVLGCVAVAAPYVITSAALGADGRPPTSERIAMGGIGFGKHLGQINSREQLKEHLPKFAELLDEAFRRNKWVYVPVRKRLDEAHLRGYDPAKAPTFRWPPKVIEAFNRIEAERAKEKEQREKRVAKK